MYKCSAWAQKWQHKGHYCASFGGKSYQSGNSCSLIWMFKQQQQAGAVWKCTWNQKKTEKPWIDYYFFAWSQMQPSSAEGGSKPRTSCQCTLRFSRTGAPCRGTCCEYLPLRLFWLSTETPDMRGWSELFFPCNKTIQPEPKKHLCVVCVSPSFELSLH